MWVTRVGLVELSPPGVHGRPESALAAVVRVHQKGPLLPHVVRPVRLLSEGACDGRGLGRGRGEQKRPTNHTFKWVARCHDDNTGGDGNGARNTQSRVRLWMAVDSGVAAANCDRREGVDGGLAMESLEPDVVGVMICKQCKQAYSSQSSYPY